MALDGSPNRTADVVIVGGGVIGCSAAFRLAQAGMKVVVLDRGEPGAEASQAAAGMLAPQGEMAESRSFFELCAASRDLYPAFLAEVEEASGYRVGYYREGSLLVALSDEECQQLEALYQAQTRLGLAIERLSPAAVLGLAPGLSPHIRLGLLIPGDHWVDNEQLLRALVAACRRLGVAVHAGHEVTKFQLQGGRLESVVAGPARDLACSAGSFVLAAGCWSQQLMAPLGIDLPMEPCRGQMLEFESCGPSPRAPRDSAHGAPLDRVVRLGHHYLVPRPPGKLLAGTTVEHAGYDKSVTGEGLRSILEGVTRFAPFVRTLRFSRAWAGLRPDTADHLPILGPGEIERLVFATGHFRNGILLAPVTARLISELLLTGSASRPLEAYGPGRFAAKQVTKE